MEPGTLSGSSNHFHFNKMSAERLIILHYTSQQKTLQTSAAAEETLTGKIISNIAAEKERKHHSQANVKFGRSA
jgi:hypothetical protein